MQKPPQIIELEKYLGFRLRETNDVEDILSWDENKIYLLDDKGEVIGLSLFGCGIKDISFLSNFTNLISLDLTDNEIKNILFLQHLTNLTNLYLGNNQISDISFLQNLTNLISLDLSENQISDISVLRDSINLVSLYLGTNQILDISFLQNLTNLTNLNMDSNQITDISILKGFLNLKNLHISHNQIIDISSLKGLTTLARLDLSNNQITDISFLKGLTNLTGLNLHNNRIRDISFLKGLTNLISLNLGKNQITNIFLSFLNQFPKLVTLYLYGNPIQNIGKEIFYKKYSNVLEDVRNFLEDAEKGTAKNNEVKLIFVGNGNAGKTQIAKRLAEQEKYVFDTQHNSTQSIAILERDLENYKLYLWDFAGQDIYHATHRLFMRTSALFVLVWDWENEGKDFHEWKGKEYKNEKLVYWLSYIRCFGGDSPVLVVQNKVDTEEQEDLKLLKEKEKELKADFPNIQSFIQVSPKENRGFTNFEKKIKDILKNVEPFASEIKKGLPISWLDIRKEIRALQQKNEKVLTFEDFKNLCEEVPKSANTLVNFFHNTGVFYYQPHYFNGNIIIKQDWAIQAIYAVLDRNSTYFEVLKGENGKLDYDNMCDIWCENTDAERKIFLDFMLSAELAFETTENKDYDTPLSQRSFIIPQLLQEDKSKQALFYEKERNIVETKTQKFAFLPAIFIQRLIIKLANLSDPEYMWQSGILFKYNDTWVLVEADYAQKNISFKMNYKNQGLLENLQKLLKEITQEGNIDRKHITDTDDTMNNYRDFLDDLKQPKKTNTMTELQQLLRDFQLGIPSQMPELLKKLQSYVNSMPLDVQGKFRNLKSKFSSRPENYNFDDWKAEIKILIESHEDDLYNQTQNSIQNKKQNSYQMNPNNIPQSFIDELKKQITKEYEMIEDTNLRRSITRNEAQKQDYEALITQCEENISYTERKFLDNIQKQNNSISESEIKSFISEIKEEIITEVKSGFAQQNQKMDTILGRMDENHKSLVYDILTKLSEKRTVVNCKF